MSRRRREPQARNRKILAARLHPSAMFAPPVRTRTSLVALHDRFSFDTALDSIGGPNLGPLVIDPPLKFGTVFCSQQHGRLQSCDNPTPMRPRQFPCDLPAISTDGDRAPLRARCPWSSTARTCIPRAHTCQARQGLCPRGSKRHGAGSNGISKSADLYCGGYKITSLPGCLNCSTSFP